LEGEDLQTQCDALQAEVEATRERALELLSEKDEELQALQAQLASRYDSHSTV
jgi:hypothetical protein